MVREDDEHVKNAKPPAKMSAEERAADLVFQLRDPERPIRTSRAAAACLPICAGREVRLTNLPRWASTRRLRASRPSCYRRFTLLRGFPPRLSLLALRPSGGDRAWAVLEELHARGIRFPHYHP